MRAWLTSEGSWEMADPKLRGQSEYLLIEALGDAATGPATLPESFRGFIIGPDFRVITF